MAIRSFFRFPKFAARNSHFIRRILIGLLIATVFLAGIQLRRWIGDTTRHVRYQHDIVNGFYWGNEVLKEARRLSPDERSANSWTGFCRGYLALYDRVKDKAYEQEYGLDYAPLRLLAMAIWAKEVRDGFPWVDNDHPKLVNPLLKINFICELVSALTAVGAMLKGQLLFVAPFFVFWPLWQKGWLPTLRVLAGFVATTALIVSPWLLRTPAAWAVLAAFAVITLLFVVRFKLTNQGASVGGIIGCAVFVIGAFTGGSFAWLQVGFIYGTEHYPYLFISSCYNLPSVLAQVGWSLKDPFLSAHFGSLHLHITLQWTLRLLYLVALALCARGLARHLRDRDPRALIAIAAPWLLMFALLGQMHERYLMWGAVVSAVALGVSVRLSIIHFILSAASTTMIVHVMLTDKKLEATLPTIDVLKHIRPYGSIVVLSCVAVYLWETISTRIPAFRPAEVRSGPTPSLSLAPEPEEA